ncbi:MAG TPA: hypothetical protein DCF33_13210 [Saprospirales bacterium]|nr:hypothetical protein [Saprospirales bacterium]
MKPIIYIDMDNVLVDFPTGIPRLSEALQKEYKGKEDDAPGIFKLMDPIPGAIESIHRLAEFYELYVLSTAPWKYPSAWSHKVEWIQKHFGKEPDSILYKRLILTHHKNLNNGHYLIDDREKNGAKDFKGEWIQFKKEPFENWEKVTAYLLNR